MKKDFDNIIHYNLDPNNKYDFIDYNKKVSEYIDKHGIGDIHTVDNLDSFRRFLRLEEILFEINGYNINFYYYWLVPFIDRDPEPFFYNIHKLHERFNVNVEQVVYLKSLAWYEDPLLNSVKDLEPKWLWLDEVEIHYHKFSLQYLSNYKLPWDFNFNHFLIKLNFFFDRMYNICFYNYYFELKLLYLKFLDLSIYHLFQQVLYSFYILMDLNSFFDYYDWIDFFLFILIDIFILYLFYKFVKFIWKI